MVHLLRVGSALCRSSIYAHRTSSKDGGAHERHGALVILLVNVCAVGEEEIDNGIWQ